MSDTTTDLPADQPYTVEANVGSDKNPHMKHRLLDKHMAFRKKEPLVARIKEFIIGTEVQDRFFQLWAQHELPDIKPDSPDPTYIEWLKMEKLIAEYEPKPEREDREAYLECFKAAVTDHYKGAMIHLPTLGGVFDAYNIDPRNMLLTLGRINMGMSIMRELIEMYPVGVIEPSEPTAEATADDGGKVVAEVAGMAIKTGTNPDVKTAKEEVADLAKGLEESVKQAKAEKPGPPPVAEVEIDPQQFLIMHLNEMQLNLTECQTKMGMLQQKMADLMKRITAE